MMSGTSWVRVPFCRSGDGLAGAKRLAAPEGLTLLSRRTIRGKHPTMAPGVVTYLAAVSQSSSVLNTFIKTSGASGAGVKYSSTKTYPSALISWGQDSYVWFYSAGQDFADPTAPRRGSGAGLGNATPDLILHTDGQQSVGRAWRPSLVRSASVGAPLGVPVTTSRS
jgi:hypothetical protein